MAKSIRKFNVITPFSRFENLDKFIEHLRQFNVRWYPIVESNAEHMDLLEKTVKEDWIFPLQMEVRDGYDKCYEKLNLFIQSGKIKEDEYYTSLCDDDFYEEGFFEKLRGYTNDILVTSMHRGDAIPREATGIRAHPTDTLIADNGNMRVGRVSHEQYFVKGKVYKNLRFQNIYYADGLMAEHLEQNYEDIAYINDAFVLFNYLEPGRYI